MKISEQVLNVLDQATIKEDKLFLNGQLDRKLYLDTNKVLEAAGGKWSRKEKCHIFTENIEDFIERTILTGEITRPQDFGFFETPLSVVNRLLQLAKIEPHMEVLEPSAGKGAIAREIANMTKKIDCIELLESNCKELKKDKCYKRISNADFLQIFPIKEYDRVIMNPPFGKQQDIKHVTHALEFLKPDGLLVSVMSSSVTFRSNRLTVDFRDIIEARNGRIEALQENAFKSSGTMARTIIVSIPGKYEN